MATADEVVKTGRPGKVTLTLTISNRQQGDPMVVIDELIGKKPPSRDPRGAFFYAVNGGLHREDPRQIKMDLRAVNVDTGEVRDLGAVSSKERIISG